MGTGKLLVSEWVFFLHATGCHSQDDLTLSRFLSGRSEWCAFWREI